MTRGVGSYPCDRCGREFGGLVTFEKHSLRSEDRCRRPAELRRIGIHPRSDGTWVRPNPVTSIRQLRLFRLGRTRKRLGRLPGPSPRGVVPADQTPTPDLFAGVPDGGRRSA